MSQNPKPIQPRTLFDFNLSGGQGGSGDKTSSMLIGCEVLSGNVEKQLLAMAGQFVADTGGWYALVLNIPGFLTHQWDHKTETLEALIPQLVELQSRVWVFLLQSNTVVVLLRMTDKTRLVSFVQNLSAALVINNNQPPKARLLDMLTQQGALVEFAKQECQRLQERGQRKKEEELQARIRNLDFEIMPDILKARGRRSRPVILLVEDDPTTAKLLEYLITSRQNMDVHIASTAEDAAVSYRRLAPDLVFLDIGLPEIDGLTLLERLTKADPEGNVVMLTANAYRENLERATRNGAKGFMAKPFTPAKLAEVISRFVK